MINESYFNRKLSEALRNAGAEVLAVVGSEMQAAGWPDRYVAHPTWTGWLEGKSATGKLRTIQRVVMAKLWARGVPCFVCRYAPALADDVTPGLPLVGVEDFNGEQLFWWSFAHGGARLLQQLKEHSQ